MVAIKDMEMPKSCWDCPILCKENGQCEVSKKYIYGNDIPTDCPLIEIEKPKTGHWIYDYTSADGHKTYHCSECGCYLQPKHSEPLNSFKWCSLCGTKMESEDKE